MPDEVECQSGFEYAQEPVAFREEGRRHTVAKILSEARTPAGKEFTVQDETGERFLLTYTVSQDAWQITRPGIAAKGK
jgi:hypothetical protein